MRKVGIITDSNSGITQEEASALGIAVLPMPFYINDQLYFEEISLSQEEFYRFLAGDADIATSQPTPADVTALWDSLLETHDAVLHFPMSAGLSGACQVAKGLGARKVMITSHGGKKMEVARACGIHRVIDTHAEDFGEAFLETFGPDKAGL